MDKFEKSNNKIPLALESLFEGYYNSNLIQDKIYNVVKIHHFKEDLNNFIVNQKLNSITLTPQLSTNQSVFNPKVQKSFLLDLVLAQETIFEDLLVSVIKRIVENENSLIVSANRGSKKICQSWNQDFLETLTTWLYHYLKICEENEYSKFSVRISALEIDEENDILTDLGKETSRDENFEDLTSFDNLNCHRCNDLNSAITFFNDLKNNQLIKCEDTRKHVLYTFHLYQQTNLKSTTCSVSTKCSKIFLLNLDLTKSRNQQNAMPLPLISKFIISHLNRQNKKTTFENRFQKIFSEILQKNISFFTFITQISAKEKKFSDSYQLLQLSGRIQRLKIKQKKNWDFQEFNYKRNDRNSHSYRDNCSFRKSGKFSDSEITSNSEFSCAETVICLREEKRRNSDDESLISKRLRSVLISSDSDSGCKDLRMSQSSYSRGATPVNSIRKRCHPRTNALAWPKSAIRMAKTAILNGQELWVDGPSVFQKAENASKRNNNSFSTISTPETVKQVLESSGKIGKTIMISQETQYEYQKIPVCEPKADFHPLSDISEITDEVDLLRNMNEYTGLNDNSYNSLNNRISQAQFNIQNERLLTANCSPKNDVKKVSRWINDVNLLTSQMPVSKSYHEQFAQKQYLQPVLNSVANHNYQYYDADSQDDYSSYPRLYSPQPSKVPVLRNDTKQISYVNDDEEKYVSISDKKLFKRYKKKEMNIGETKDFSKLRSFMSKSPLGILKKTFFQTKSGKKKTDVPEYAADTNCTVTNCPEVRYLVPAMQTEDSSDSSSDSECNEWFRNIKTFKSKIDTITNKYSALRPPSAPLLVGSNSVLHSQHTTRQRSSSSGYGSVITKDSEISSHIDSNSDQSIHSASKPSIKQSISFTHNRNHSSVPSELDPDVIAQRCESLVKQEKAILLMTHQELMIQDFYNTARPLLTTDESKYTLRMSTINYDRLLFDNQYLEELEEDTNIIRDSIAFYKSLIHLESSFLSSPERHRKLLN